MHGPVALGRHTVHASSTNADGIKILDTYDNGGRLTAKSYMAANGAQIDAESYTYNQDNMETAASNGVGSYGFTYDPAERITQETGLFGLTLNYTNDANGNVTQVTDSAGGTVTSAYDANNRLQSRSFSETGAALRIELTYNAQSEITDEKRYNAATGGTLVGETTQSFDAVGGVTAITHKDGSANTLENFSYSYDGAERPSSETDTISGTPTTTNYGYDGANQLTSAGSSNYNYDLTGNRNTGANQVGPDNQLVADANWTYKYDPAGKEIEKDGKAGTQYAGIVWKYGFDGADRLVSATETGGSNYTVTFAYDVFGNRVEKDVTQGSTTTITRFAYDTVDGNGNAFADLNSTNTVTTRREYLNSVDSVFARIGQTGTIAWYLTDHLGSVRGLMNNSNSLIDALTYDAYGNLTSETSPSNGDRYAYTGRERDVETGLQYNRARYYDPSTGRWISQDPLGFDAGDSNLYRYVNNRPLVSRDPSGFEPVTIDMQSKEAWLKEEGDIGQMPKNTVWITTDGEFKKYITDCVKKNGLIKELWLGGHSGQPGILNISPQEQLEFDTYEKMIAAKKQHPDGIFWKSMNKPFEMIDFIKENMAKDGEVVYVQCMVPGKEFDALKARLEKSFSPIKVVVFSGQCGFFEGKPSPVLSHRARIRPGTVFSGSGSFGLGVRLGASLFGPGQGSALKSAFDLLGRPLIPVP
jgi:RHS repeat-associated protein